MIHLKNEKQINGIRESCRLLARMFDHVIPKVQAGMSTKDIDDICFEFVRRHGGTPAWHKEDFPGTACISINNEVSHGIPSRKRHVRDGDIVSLDVGIDLHGYISDSTVSVLVGNVSEEARRLVEVAEQCLAAGIAACRAGNRISDIAHAVYDIAHSAGYGVVYEYCGHGVGLAVHEDPSVPNCPSRGRNPRIQPGMVLAIEPMINQGTGDVILADDGWTVLTADGKLSAHAEHTVAVFPDHTEVLTQR